MKYYIGLDAHSTTSTFAVVNEQGDCVLRETVITSEKNLVYVINKVHGVRSLTFEESTISQWLYLQLKDTVDELLVCNPTYVAKKSGAKTDFRDALHLAHELRTNHLQPVFHDASHWSEIRVSVSGYLDIVQEIVRFKNRLKSLFRAEALSTSENSFYKNKDLVNGLKNPSAKFVAEKLFNQIEFLESEKLKYRDLFTKNKKQYRPIRNLITIPGINLIRANIIAAIVCQPARFKNKHRFWGYCMLVRHIQKSGGKIYGNKRFFGRRELRDVFIGAAESALRTDSTLRDYYDALRAKGINHKAAKLSLARRIASISLCLLKNNDTYNDNYDEYLKERKRLRLEFYNQKI
ncbi:MAG: transposase [Halobacteriovoraceae bacterium]|nr:transposase [Halobacteriovoraceae bacterium]